MSTTAFSKRGMAVLAVLYLVAAQPALAQEQPTQPQAQQKEHTVKPGDTLWDLAAFYLNDPFRWPLIYQANLSVVENPHRIYPAERLIIPGVPADATRVAVEPQDVEPIGRAPERTMFYSPPAVLGPTLISTERSANTLVQQSEWVSAPWIADSASVQVVAEVFKPMDPRLQQDRLRSLFHPQTQLILRTVNEGTKAGDRLLAVRMTEKLPGLGTVIVPMGVLRVDSIGPTRAVATIESQFADLRVDDLAMPLPLAPEMPQGDLIEVTGGPVGELVELLVDQPLVGTEEIAFVTLGARHGVTVGDELLAYIPERRESQRSPELLPEQQIGRLRVIKVTNDIATVRVIGVESPLLRRGLPVRVLRRVQ